MKPCLSYDTLDHQSQCLAARIENIQGVRNLYVRQLKGSLKTKLSPATIKRHIARCDRNLSLLQIELACLFAAH